MPRTDDLHASLRRATQETHERLHHHPGLAAVAAGTILLPQYRQLLVRLWGFHAAFERQLAQAAEAGLIEPALAERRRSHLLEQDLMSLEALSAGGSDPLTECPSLHQPSSRAGFLGSLYVVEGSTLGGTVLARALVPVTGEGPDAARRFFVGYGDANGRHWRDLLGRLVSLAGDETAEREAVASAVATFRDFEVWMSIDG